MQVFLCARRSSYLALTRRYDPPDVAAICLLGCRHGSHKLSARAATRVLLPDSCILWLLFMISLHRPIACRSTFASPSSFLVCFFLTSSASLLCCSSHRLVGYFRQVGGQADSGSTCNSSGAGTASQRSDHELSCSCTHPPCRSEAGSGEPRQAHDSTFKRLLSWLLYVAFGIMAVGAGPLYVNAVMGQAPSASQRDHVRETSLQITARHDIDIEESEQPSRPDSWSLHYDRTDQAPYSTGVPNTMMTQTSLLNLPKGNPSRDLAFFLTTTGPSPPHRRPSKVEEHPRRGVSNPKNALRFLRLGHKRSQTPVFPPNEKTIDDLQLHPLGNDRGRMNGVLRDEGGLLFGRKKQAKDDVQSKKPRMDRVASPFVQEVSSAGE